MKLRTSTVIDGGDGRPGCGGDIRYFGPEIRGHGMTRSPHSPFMIYRIMYIMENIRYVFLFRWLDSAVNPFPNLRADADQASGTSNSMPS